MNASFEFSPPAMNKVAKKFLHTAKKFRIVNFISSNFRVSLYLREIFPQSTEISKEEPIENNRFS